MTSSSMPTPLVLGRHPLWGTLINHEQLRRAIKLAQHDCKAPGIQVWTGEPGVGKTVAAEQLVAECNAAADAAEPEAFRAVYLSTGGDVHHNTTRGMKRGINCIFEGVLKEELTNAEYRSISERALAEMIVEHVRLLNIRLIVLDEAGTKTQSEIRGISYITDVAIERHWCLSILLVGMDDLADKADREIATRSRTRRTTMFTPWSASELFAFLQTRDGVIGEAFARGGSDAEAVATLLCEAVDGDVRSLLTHLNELTLRLENGVPLRRAAMKVIEMRDHMRKQAVAFARGFELRKQRHPV